jgi:hypothetical protein
MNKKLVVIMTVMTTSLLLNGMENVIQLKNLKRSKTVDQGSESRRPEGAENAPDMRLDIGSIPEPLFSSANGKRSIKKLDHVDHLKSSQTTYRQTTARGGNDTQSSGLRSRHNNNNNLRVQNDDNQKDDILDTDLKQTRTGLEELSLNNGFSEQDMWDLLKKSNPKLYTYAQENHLEIGDVKNCSYDFDNIDPQIHNLFKQFGKKKSLSLEQMMEYAHLLENFHIDPEVLGQLLQKQHGLSDGVMSELVQKFSSMQKNDKEQYLAVAFDFITRTLDEGGIKDPSPIHAAHVAIQNDTIADEKKQKWVSVAGNIIFLLSAAGMAAWGLYGQITGPATHAPTNTPTVAPTMFPTGAPT